MNKATVKAYFDIAIRFIAAKELGALFASLGYDQVVTADLCITALNENGKDFSIPFGKLAKDALLRPDAKAYIRAALESTAVSFKGRNSRWKRTMPVTNLSFFDSEKADGAVNIIDSIGNVLVGGVGSTAELILATKNSGVSQQDVDLQTAKNESARVRIDENKWWIIGGVGVLAVVVIFIAIVISRKHQ